MAALLVAGLVRWWGRTLKTIVWLLIAAGMWKIVSGWFGPSDFAGAPPAGSAALSSTPPSMDKSVAIDPPRMKSRRLNSEAGGCCEFMRAILASRGPDFH